jgi:DNA-binding NtrC family response regulator
VGSAEGGLAVLVIDRDEDVAAQLTVVAERAAGYAHWVTTPREAFAALEARCYDIAIVEADATVYDGIALAQNIRRLAPSTLLLLNAANGSIEDAVAATKAGIGYATGSLAGDALARALTEVSEQRAVERALTAERNDTLLPTPLVGNSPAMTQLKHNIEVIANNDGAVLVCGESGTGKELVARMLHVTSPRRAKPFVAVNCAAFPDALLDAELFGHERGAFTGADRLREGRFEAADGGTLFLDEIGEMPLSAQAKLLRVLENGTFQRLGANETRKVDVRVVSASNRDLAQLVRAGGFREDLYYRIKLFRVRVPALRERGGDLPLLVEHFCRRYAKPGRPTPRLSPGARAVLASREFRGNVRELEHAIRHAIAFADGGELLVEHLPAEIAGDALDFERGRDRGDPAPSVLPLTSALTEFEHEYLLQTLQRTDGNRSRAASLLGISRKSLWAKLKRYREQTPCMSVANS